MLSIIAVTAILLLAAYSYFSREQNKIELPPPQSHFQNSPPVFEDPKIFSTANFDQTKTQTTLPPTTEKVIKQDFQNELNRWLRSTNDLEVTPEQIKKLEELVHTNITEFHRILHIIGGDSALKKYASSQYSGRFLEQVVKLIPLFQRPDFSSLEKKWGTRFINSDNELRDYLTTLPKANDDDPYFTLKTTFEEMPEMKAALLKQFNQLVKEHANSSEMQDYLELINTKKITDSDLDELKSDCAADPKPSACLKKACTIFVLYDIPLTREQRLKLIEMQKEFTPNKRNKTPNPQ